MPTSYPLCRGAQQPFVITSYRVGTSNRLEPEIPDQCPATLGLVTDSDACCITIDHYRERKTGPGRVAVARCATHNRAFTLYPPGFAPYRRQPVAHVAPDGSTLHGEQTDTPRSPFADSLFDAALAAARGNAWSRHSQTSSADRWWSTQGRHLRLAERLVGVAADLTDQVRQAIAATLSIDVLTLRDLKPAAGYRAIGKAVRHVLGQVRSTASAAFSLLCTGHMIGHWGEPLRWDSKRRRYRRHPFRGAGTGMHPMAS